MKKLYFILALAFLLTGAVATEERYYYQLPLEYGWNLVSIPVEGAQYIRANHEYQGQCDFGPDSPPAHYFNGDSYESAGKFQDGTVQLEFGKGYWVYSDRSCEVSFANPLYSQRIQAYDHLALRGGITGNVRTVRGWNLIGSTWTGSVFSDIQNNCHILSGPLSYEDGNYQGDIRRDYRQVNKLKPGKGYWVYVDQDCQLNGFTPDNTIYT